MKRIKKPLPLLLAAALLCVLFVLPGGAQSPISPKMKNLMEQKYGHKLDCLIAQMSTDDVEHYSFANDPQVTGIRLITPNMKDLNIVSISLNTFGEAELDSFIEKYGEEPDVIRIEKDDLMYIPESGFGVVVTLKLMDAENVFFPPAEFTPADFTPAAVSDDLIKKVHPVSVITAMSEEDKIAVKAAYGKLPDPALPQKLLLDLTDHSPSNAASLALDLIGFEANDLFTEQQKELFRARVADVDIVEYDFVSSEDPLGDLAGERVFRVWSKGDPDFSVLEDTCTAYRVAADQYYQLWYVVPSAENCDPDSLQKIADVLDAMPLVSGLYRCYTGVDIQPLQVKDSTAAYYFYDSAPMPGDADGDYAVTAADARLALRAAVELDHPSASVNFALDADGDGEVTAADARTLLRAAVGLVPAEWLTFTLKPDQTLILGPFPYNDGGYQWSVTLVSGDPDDIRIYQRQADIIPPHVAGAGVSVFYTLTPQTEGKFVFHVELKRPWLPYEDPEAVAISYDVRVVCSRTLPPSRPPQPDNGE